MLGKAAQRSITEMRRQVQRHVGRLSVGYFEQTKAGALLSRVMNDAEGIRNLVGTGLVEVVGGLITAVFALGILFHLNAKLTLIALGVLSLFAFVMQYAFKTLRPLFRERSKINAEISGRLTESFSGRAGGQGLPGGAAGGAGVHQGGPPPLPQRGPDDDQLLGDRRRLDAAARGDRRHHHGDRRAATSSTGG